MPSRVFSFLLGLMLVMGASHAGATYNEWHLTGSDTRVVIDRDAKAVVQQQIGLRVVAGSMRALSLPSYPADAVFEPGGKVTADDGRTFALSVGRDGDAFAQAITQDALKRGDYTFSFRYHIDLRQGRIAPDGALTRVTFVAPPLNEGIDGARVVFDLPASPTEPRLVVDEQGGVLATARRTADRDELELIRPHVPRGDSVTWVIRVDPTALAATALVAKAPLIEARRPLDRAPFIAAGLGLLYALAWAHKRRSFSRECDRSRARFRGLPAGVGFLIALSGVGGAVYERTLGRPILAGALVAVTTAALVLRAHVNANPRGPGQWVALRPRDTFGRDDSGSAWDAHATAGKRALATLAVITTIASWMLARRGGEWDTPWLLMFAVAPMFVTGTRAQLTAGPRRQASVLRAIYELLSGDPSFKVTPWARMPSHSARPDEVRLLVLPRAPIPGLFGVEVATVWEPRVGTLVPGTEVLVRVHEDSPASAKLAAIGASARPGRKPEERVFSFTPDWPSDRSTTALARSWAERMVDRRVRDACIWLGGEERRGASSTAIA